MGIWCRLDGILDGVSGRLPADVDRERIAQTMGWADSRDAVPVITRTLELLAQGKAVRLKSSRGYCVFSPLADGEDGAKIPASYREIYDGEGNLVERAV